MIEQLIVVVLGVSVIFILGIVYGQHSVWLSLREKGNITIDEWCYTAVKINKRWK